MATLAFGGWSALKQLVIEQQYGGVAADAYEEEIRLERPANPHETRLFRGES